MLLQRSTAEGVKQDFQGGVGANLVERLAFVLEYFLAGHFLCTENAAFGRAVHVFDKVALQGAVEQRVLLVDEGTRGSVGQMLDGLAAQDGEFASARIPRAQLPVGFRQIIAHQAQ
ncbi:hypothetical protein D3C71_1880850 [compost metagenome]